MDVPMDSHKSFRSMLSWNRFRVLLAEESPVMRWLGGGRVVKDQENFQDLSQKGHGCDLLRCVRNLNKQTRKGTQTTMQMCSDHN